MDCSSKVKVDNQLCFSLYRLSKMLTQKYQDFLNELGITYPQYLVFLVLLEKGPRSVKSIGECLSLDSGTLSPLLKRLEDKKLIEKKKDEYDERSVQVVLTNEAVELLEKIKEIPNRMMCDLPWPEEKLLGLKGDLDELYQACLKKKEEGGC